MLERALLFSLVMHTVAIGSMLWLLPGLPGGGTTDPPARMHYVAASSWRWRAGWLPWQLTALSDLLIGIALVRARIVPKVPAVATLVLTVAAIVPDQIGQGSWVTHGVDLARLGNPSAYVAFETRAFRSIAVWGATLYSVAAVGWTWTLVSIGIWNRALTLLSAIVWPLFLVTSAAPLVSSAPLPVTIVAAGNAVGFVLLEAWLVIVVELTLRRDRPDARYGRLAPWKHPSSPLWNLLANSRLLRALAEPLPPVAFVSDITDVFYVNYVVDAERLEGLVPDGLELQRIGPDSRYAIFTFLTFHHGHFGPSLLGLLRGMLPSPIQTNWRIHVCDPRRGTQGVYFVTTAIGSTLHALAARLLAEGLPMHVLRSASVGREDGCFTLALDPGEGSAPDASARLRPIAIPSTGPWSRAFETWHDALAYIVPQDRAMSTQTWRGCVTRQEIALGISPTMCEPLEGDVTSKAAAAIVGDAEPFCFRVPSVFFRFAREEHDR